MRVLAGLALSLLAALIAGSIEVAGQLDACPLVARLSTLPKATGRGVMAGNRVLVNVKVINPRKLLGQGGVTINLPPGLCVQSTSRGAEIVPESGNVFWPNLDFSKKVVYKFKLKAHVQSNFNGSIAAITAAAYIPERNCITKASPVQVGVTQASPSSQIK